MRRYHRAPLSCLVLSTAPLLSALACAPAPAPVKTADTAPPAGPVAPAAQNKTVLDLAALTSNPSAYEWFEFRPNLQKLILAGAADTEHVALLWYTVPGGRVGLHRHSQTESVFVIDGTQTDAKGTYPTGTVYFNPPGSGHEITDSSGFFILAYAAPPNFQHTEEIEAYEPIRIDTTAAGLTDTYPFAIRAPGVRTYRLPLNTTGGMRAELVSLASSENALRFDANYVLVLDGSCSIDGVVAGKLTLVVTPDVMPRPFAVSTPAHGACLAMSVTFQSAD